MNNFSKINVIREYNFLDAWMKAIHFVMENGISIVFGDKEEQKVARDSCQLIELSGYAIEQITNREVHPKFPFRGRSLEEYCRKFSREYLSEYNNMNIDDRADYIYFDRLANYPENIDQIVKMRNSLREQIQCGVVSNRTQAITWNVKTDPENRNVPCLQRIWIRYSGDMKVDIHLEWRSRDLLKAWAANIIAIIDMIQREVLTQNNCEVGRIVDFSDSLHIYEEDIDLLKDIMSVMSPNIINH